MAESGPIKATVAARVDGDREELVRLSEQVHGYAELGFEEEQSSRAVADLIAEAGYDVEFGVADLPTAFTATIGTGELVIGICAEYDALPGIGHACGHNIIASAAVGAARALAGLVDDLDITVKVFGTPAEEGGGGKILMLDAGVMDGVHAAMMVHPTPYEAPLMPCLAVSHFDVAFSGKTAHASAYPQLGINALDAMTISQTAIGLLRQQLPAEARVHGIIKRGGQAPNVIPDDVLGTWYVRDRTLAALEETEARVRRCFEAGALATGATVEFEAVSPPYSEFIYDPDLVHVYTRNAIALGRLFEQPTPGQGMGDLLRVAGSTDMANVSLAIPSIHPLLGIESNGAVNHQPEFTAACVGESANLAVRDGAVGMAQTVVDVARDEHLRRRLIDGAPSSTTQDELYAELLRGDLTTAG